MVSPFIAKLAPPPFLFPLSSVLVPLSSFLFPSPSTPPSSLYTLPLPSPTPFFFFLLTRDPKIVDPPVDYGFLFLNIKYKISSSIISHK